jgi:hypothetical protein
MKTDLLRVLLTFSTGAFILVQSTIHNRPAGHNNQAMPQMHFITPVAYICKSTEERAELIEILHKIGYVSSGYTPDSGFTFPQLVTCWISHNAYTNRPDHEKQQCTASSPQEFIALAAMTDWPELNYMEHFTWKEPGQHSVEGKAPVLWYLRRDVQGIEFPRIYYGYRTITPSRTWTGEDWMAKASLNMVRKLTNEEIIAHYRALEMAEDLAGQSVEAGNGTNSARSTYTGIHILSNVPELYWAFQNHLRNLGIIKDIQPWTDAHIKSGLYHDISSTRRQFAVKPNDTSPNNYQYFFLPTDWNEAVEACRQTFRKQPKEFQLIGSNKGISIMIGETDNQHVHVISEKKHVHIKYIENLLHVGNTFGDTDWNITYTRFNIGCLHDIKREDLVNLLAEHHKWWNKT